jgi:hypothetical protein
MAGFNIPLGKLYNVNDITMSGINIPSGSTYSINNVVVYPSGLTQLSIPTLSTPSIISATELDLSWTQITNNVGYKVQYSLNNSTWIDLITTSTNTNTYNNTGLTSSTLYYYKVLALGDGSTYSNSNYSTTQSAVTSSSSVSGLYTFDWSTIGTFPTNMSLNTDGNTCDWGTPTVPNTLGSPSISSIISGTDGWHLNTAYNNNQCSVNSTIVRHTNKSSVRLQLYPFSPSIPNCYDSGVSGGLGASNLRAEMYLSGSNYGYILPYPSELWMSWSYYFPAIENVFDSYYNPSTGDSAEGSIHQIYVGPPGVSPPIEICTHAVSGNNILVYVGTTVHNTHYPLVAGVWLDFIEHIVWDNSGAGTYQLWIKNVSTGVETLVLDLNGVTTTGGYAAAGTPKLGFYHYYWHSATTTPALHSTTASTYNNYTPTDHLELYLGQTKLEINLPGNYKPYVSPSNQGGKLDVQP